MRSFIIPANSSGDAPTRYVDRQTDEQTDVIHLYPQTYVPVRTIKRLICQQKNLHIYYIMNWMEGGGLE